MSDESLPRDLISGYLDSQLTPDQRAQAEALLRDDAEMRSLLESLRRQSNECGALPRFALDKEFSQRVLQDARIEQSFSRLAEHRAVKSDQHNSYTTTRPFGYAVAAIGSLAALVLITLFVQNPEPTTTSIAAKSDNAKAAELSMDEELAAGLREESDQSGIADRDHVAYQPSDARARNMNEKTQFKSGKAGAVIDNKFESVPDVNNGLQQFAVEANKETKNEPQNELLVDRSKDVELRSDEGLASNSRMRRLAIKSTEEEPDQDIAESRKQDFQQLAQQPSVQLGQAMKKQIDSSRPQQFAGLAIHAADSSIDKSLAIVPPVNDVIEVYYAGGPEKIVEFEHALSRHDFFVGGENMQSAPEPLLDTENLALAKNAFRALGGGGAGLNNQNKESTDDEVAADNRFAIQKLDQPSSQLYLVNANSKQMIDLITDLDQNAQVSGFRFELNQDLKPAASNVPEQLARSQVSGTNIIGRESKVASNQPQGGMAPLEKASDMAQSNVVDAPKPGTDSAKLKSSGRAGSNQLAIAPGTAVPLKRLPQLRGNRRGVPSDSKAPVVSGEAAKKQNVDLSEQEKLYAYFGKPDNADIRPYLLFVRTREGLPLPAAATLESSSEAIPGAVPKK